MYNLERATPLLAIGGIAAFVSTRSPIKCGTHVRKTVTGEIMSARYLRECADDCEEKPRRLISRARAKRPLRSVICFTVARIDITRNRSIACNRWVQSRASIVLRSKGFTRAFVTRVPREGKKTRRGVSEQ